MAWTTPPTYTASVLSVATANAQWRDNLNYLFSGAVIAGLYGSTSSIAYASWSAISYDNTQVSNGSVTVAGSGFTVGAGNYLLVANGYPPTTDAWQTRILAAGTVIAIGGSSDGRGYSCSAIYHVNSSTAFTTEGIVTSGGSGHDLIAFSGVPNFMIFQVNG